MFTTLRKRASRYPAAAFLALTSLACGGGGTTPPGRQLADAEFTAFIDRDGDGLSSNDAPTQTRFSEWFARNKPGTKIIMINAAAGWCGPCMEEASAMNTFAAAYQPRGVVVVTSVFQDNRGQPADEAFAKLWAETFQLAIPTLVDSAFTMGSYFDAKTMPSNMFVDADTTEILSIETGATPGGDPMKEYRELLDHYLE